MREFPKEEKEEIAELVKANLETRQELSKGNVGDRVDILNEIVYGPETPIYEPPAFEAPVVKRGQLRFLIGLQRSGKSTWATRWMRQSPRVENGILFPRVVVCADNIRLALTGQRYNRHAEPTVFMIKNYMLESLLSRGHDVLCDGTHTTTVSIRRILEIDDDAKFTLINTPVEVCKARAVACGQKDLVAVLDRTGRQLQQLLDKGIPRVIEEIKGQIRERRGKGVVAQCQQ